MHMSECCESFRRRRSIDFQRHRSSSGEEEDAEDKSSEKGSDRGGYAAPGFPRSRKLQPGQNRRALQRVCLESTCALPRIARRTTASAAVTTEGTTESGA